MKLAIALVALLLSACGSLAESSQWEWRGRAGGTTESIAQANVECRLMAQRYPGSENDLHERCMYQKNYIKYYPYRKD